MRARADLDAAIAKLGRPGLLKTRRLGYDGKGQVRINSANEADAAWEALQGAPSLLEGFIAFDAEFSILLCRGADGELVCWDAPHNIHTDGILDCGAAGTFQVEAASTEPLPMTGQLVKAGDSA